MSPNPDTIARLLNQAGAHLKEALRHPTAGHVDMAAPHVDAAMHCIHQAFQEAIGGAAYARPEPSHQPAAPAADRPYVFAVRIVDEGEVPGDTCRAVTQFMEPRQPPAPSDERTVVVGGRRLRVVLRGPCYLDAPIEDCCVRAVVVDDDDAAPKAEPAAPAAVAGWVVKDITPGDPRPFLGRNHCWAPTTVDARPFTERADAEEAAKYGWSCLVTVLPVDAAGNVLEERAPAPDVVAQCRAAESEPAPREPDGWIVVDGRGWSEGAWTRGETDDPEKCAKSHAAQCGPGYTARPFWLDTPLASDEASAERLTAAELLKRGGEWLGVARTWIQRIARNGSAVTWGSRDLLQCDVHVDDVERLAAEVAAVAMAAQPGEVTLSARLRALWEAQREAATLRAEVERLTRERDEARLGGVRHALGCMVRAYELDGVTASKLAEMLGWRVGELHGDGLQAVANMIFEAATELPKALAIARQCREVALGERERIADRLLGRAAHMVRRLPAPTLPEVP